MAGAVFLGTEPIPRHPSIPGTESILRHPCILMLPGPALLRHLPKTQELKKCLDKALSTYWDSCGCPV